MLQPHHRPQARSRIRGAGVLTLLCIILALPACQRDSGGAVPPTPKLEIEEVARDPFDAHLTLVNNSGLIDYNGAVADIATRDIVLGALKGSLGEDRLSGMLEVDTIARPATWASGLPPLLDAFGTANGAALRFEGDRIVLTGLADTETRARLRQAAQSAFPDAKLEGLFVAEAAASPELQVAAGDAAKLARSLSALPIRFDDGAGNVSADSLDIIVQAADAIRKAPEGTRLRIVGPVVAESDGANALFLSKQRAEALKVQLILNGVNPGVIETRGWGEDTQGQKDTPQATAPAAPPEGAPLRFELVR